MIPHGFGLAGAGLPKPLDFSLHSSQIIWRGKVGFDGTHLESGPRRAHGSRPVADDAHVRAREHMHEDRQGGQAGSPSITKEQLDCRRTIGIGMVQIAVMESPNGIRRRFRASQNRAGTREALSGQRPSLVRCSAPWSMEV